MSNSIRNLLVIDKTFKKNCLNRVLWWGRVLAVVGNSLEMWVTKLLYFLVFYKIKLMKSNKLFLWWKGTNDELNFVTILFYLIVQQIIKYMFSFLMPEVLELLYSLAGFTKIDKELNWGSGPNSRKLVLGHPQFLKTCGYS